LTAPLIIAHRGKHDTVPENSAAAVVAALEIGAQAIEIDVRKTRDGVVVLHHNAVALDTSAGRLAQRYQIAKVNSDRLASIKLHGGHEVATLNEVLKLAAGRAHVHVEVKGRNMEEEVLGCIARSGCEASVHSFDHRVIVRCSQLEPEIPRGILLDSYLVDTARVMRETGARDVWQQFEFVDEDLVHMVHDSGGRVVAWRTAASRRARARRTGRRLSRPR
jgi:glycerophosphoryl diester phosphodiesterase